VPGDATVIAFALMMPSSANRELKLKSRAIVWRAMSFHTSADAANSINHHPTSMAQLPDGGALKFPLLLR
jgi:hypothetical protein